MSEEPGSPRACFVVSAPSGAGKTTLADALLARLPRLTRTISCTTRAARAGETHGRDYFFIEPAAFDRMREAGEFLECATVHGNSYGTPRSELGRISDLGHDAVMVIDVQGAATVRRKLPGAVTIFVLPPSRDSLVMRLTGRDARDADARAAIRSRLAVAADEIRRYVGYDYLIINDDFEEAAADLVGIVRATRSRRTNLATRAEAIMASFLAGEPLSDPVVDSTGEAES